MQKFTFVTLSLLTFLAFLVPSECNECNKTGKMNEKCVNFSVYFSIIISFFNYDTTTFFTKYVARSMLVVNQDPTIDSLVTLKTQNRIACAICMVAIP